MKNLWLHGIYLTVIGVLSFQLWAKTLATRLAFEQVDRVLESNCTFFDWNAEYLFQDIEKQTESNPLSYKTYFDSGKQLREDSKLATNFIDKLSREVQNHIKLDLNIIKASLNFYLTSLTNIQNKEDSLSLIKRYGLFKTIQNDSFWKYFKVNEMSNLFLLKNQFKLDEISYLIYIQNKVSGRMLTGCNDCFRVAIAPKKAAIIEGEKFEADIYLAKYTNSAVGTEITFTVDNQNLPFKEDVAHYSKIENKTGIKKLKAVVSFRNILTGDIMTRNGEFQYHVLPKCSQNCQ